MNLFILAMALGNLEFNERNVVYVVILRVSRMFILFISILLFDQCAFNKLSSAKKKCILQFDVPMCYLESLGTPRTTSTKFPVKAE